ncbi:MAG: fatty acid desaturase [Opitutales bacterium]
MRIKNWDTFSFIAIYHLLVIALLPFAVAAFSWKAVPLFLVTYVIGGLSITAGYHRLFAHRSYQANAFYEWAVLISSMLAFQWTALAWSHDHRLHHNHVDTDKDPYSIKKGFWYAHVLWLFNYKRDIQDHLVRDLLKNPRVMFQHKYYLPLAIAVNFGVWGLGCLFMEPVTALYFGVVLRIFAIHHSTWFINSLAHTIGSKTYARELSAVDNALLALVTFGEGYHNYHHAFASDYRNGVRWYHFDPTKWLVWTASRLGLVKQLRTVNQVRIQRKLVAKDFQLFREHLSEHIDERATEVRARLEELAHSFEASAAALLEKVQQLKKATGEQRQLLRIEIRRHKQEISAAWRAWLELTDLASRQFHLTHAH